MTRRQLAVSLNAIGFLCKSAVGARSNDLSCRAAFRCAWRQCHWSAPEGETNCVPKPRSIRLIARSARSTDELVWFAWRGYGWHKPNDRSRRIVHTMAKSCEQRRYKHTYWAYWAYWAEGFGRKHLNRVILLAAIHSWESAPPNMPTWYCSYTWELHGTGGKACAGSGGLRRTSTWLAEMGTVAIARISSMCLASHDKHGRYRSLATLLQPVSPSETGYRQDFQRVTKFELVGPFAVMWYADSTRPSRPIKLLHRLRCIVYFGHFACA